MEWPGRIASVEEVDIETTRGAGAPVHRTTIWAVIGDGEVYVRSLNGEDGREKYAGSPYLHTMVRDEIAPTTVRLEPR
jgi:Uncharacterized protein conserved in bacteria (DUF2255)